MLVTCNPRYRASSRYRAHFLCLLNRAAVAEAKRFNDCVRGSWPMIMQTFPELGLWRDLRDAIQRRVWDTSGEPEPPQEEPPAQQEKELLTFASAGQDAWRLLLDDLSPNSGRWARMFPRFRIAQTSIDTARLHN